MRKSFDGLCGIVTAELGRDPLSGDVYLFLNRRRDRMKLLLWDLDGFWIFYKRLEKGTFELPSNSIDKSCFEIGYDELLLIIAGIDLASVKKRSRYQPGK